jgi:hypothetical protein
VDNSVLFVEILPAVVHSVATTTDTTTIADMAIAMKAEAITDAIHAVMAVVNNSTRATMAVVVVVVVDMVAEEEPLIEAAVTTIATATTTSFLADVRAITVVTIEAVEAAIVVLGAETITLVIIVAVVK